jgi:hypothetical protein
MATRRELLGVTVLAGASAFTLWPRRTPVRRWPLAGRSGWDGELQDARDCTSAEGSRARTNVPP